MNFFKSILKFLIGIIVLILIIALFLPKTVTVSSETIINQPASMVFHQSATFQDRAQWDPWMKLDPTATSESFYNEGYAGSWYTWKGDKMESGTIRIDSVHFPDYIASSIVFEDKPSKSTIEWSFKGEDTTRVTWSFTTQTTYPVNRIMMQILRNRLQSNFNDGIANFKNHLEAMPARLSRMTPVKKDTIPAMTALEAIGKASMETIGEKMGDLYAALMKEIQKQKLQITGPPYSRYKDFNEDGTITFYAGMPVDKLGKNTKIIKAVQFPAMNVLQVKHFGPYEELHYSHEQLKTFADANQFAVADETWEFYLNDPSTVSAPELETQIVIPLK